MARFYDHPQTGKLHFAALAGGHGGGATSEFDAPATKEDIRNHANAHAQYLSEKRAAEAEAKAQASEVEQHAALKAEIEADTEKL